MFYGAYVWFMFLGDVQVDTMVFATRAACEQAAEVFKENHSCIAVPLVK